MLRNIAGVRAAQRHRQPACGIACSGPGCRRGCHCRTSAGRCRQRQPQPWPRQPSASDTGIRSEREPRWRNAHQEREHGQHDRRQHEAGDDGGQHVPGSPTGREPHGDGVSVIVGLQAHKIASNLLQSGGYRLRQAGVVHRIRFAIVDYVHALLCESR